MLGHPRRNWLFSKGCCERSRRLVREEIDSGRWCKDVVTYDGPVAFTFAIPDLLEPPSPQAWIQRGFAPDRRAHERVFADMQRYLEEHPPTGEDELTSINRLFAGRSLDDPLTQPRSPAEQAQDLCFQAFDTHGRRRVQLARQALATRSRLRRCPCHPGRTSRHARRRARPFSPRHAGSRANTWFGMLR